MAIGQLLDNYCTFIALECTFSQLKLRFKTAQNKDVAAVRTHEKVSKHLSNFYCYMIDFGIHTTQFDDLITILINCGCMCRAASFPSAQKIVGGAVDMVFEFSIVFMNFELIIFG